MNETKTRKVGPGGFEITERKTGKVLGRYGGRDGDKWAETADGETLTEGTRASVGVLKSLIVAASKTKRDHEQPSNEKS